MLSTQTFFPADFFVIRTPLLPLRELIRWADALPSQQPAIHSQLSTNQAILTETLAADRQTMRGLLQTMLNQPLIQEAIFVASSDLSTALRHWQENPNSEKGVRAERSLLRYLLRMAGRATPFGLFSGYSLGKVGRQSRFQLTATNHYQRNTRLDTDYLFALCESLGQDATIQSRLRYTPNSSLYRQAAHYRYAEATLNEKSRRYQLVVVEADHYLKTTLAHAQAGATPQTLAEILMAEDADINQTEAAGYVTELINSQVLVSPLTPAVTGHEPIHQLLGVLEQAKTLPALPPHSSPTDPIQPLIDTLMATDQALAQLDSEGLGLAVDRYHAIASALHALPAPVRLDRLFQVDLLKPTVTMTIGQAVLAEISRGISLLQRITPAPDSDPLTTFRQRFVARYEQRKVPLVEVLDEESGVGFRVEMNRDHALLLEGLHFPLSNNETNEKWNRRQQSLLTRLDTIWRNGEQVMALSDHDIEALTNPAPLPLPKSFAVMATVAAQSPTALEAGDFRLLFHGLSGPSGARLLGRFCHGDPQLRSHVESYLAAEAACHPEAILAEIVHLPEGRIGNVLCRPSLRQYEIPYLGLSGVADDFQLSINDLMIEVIDDEIVLSSQRLNRRILPRLSSAHNFSLSNQGIYSFLCMLQGQGVAGSLGWEWGALADAAFLPRVTAGRLVLARARWRMTKLEIEQIAKQSGAALWCAIQSWRHQRQLPRWVLLSDSDNELPIDLENILCLESFVDLIKQRDNTLLHELYPGADELCVVGPEGSYVHELVIPFNCEPEPKPMGEAAQIATKTKRQRFTGQPNEKMGLTTPHLVRRFAPGSEWLYLKLYVGAATADQVLCEVVAPLLTEPVVAKIVDRWFFLRYADPDWHLRLRFHGDPDPLLRVVMPMFHAALAPWLSDQRIWKLQVDTYEREVERYGGSIGIELAEQLFHADSVAALQLVESFTGDEGANARWQLSLLGMDRLLDDLGFDLTRKLSVLQTMSRNFKREFQVDGKLRGQLGDKYRKERKNIESLLHNELPETHPLAIGALRLQQRSVQLQPVVTSLLHAEAQGPLEASLDELAQSFLHMHVNRMLRSMQRPHEVVLYDFLVRYYEMVKARN